MPSYWAGLLDSIFLFFDIKGWIFNENAILSRAKTLNYLISFVNYPSYFISSSLFKISSFSIAQNFLVYEISSRENKIENVIIFIHGGAFLFDILPTHWAFLNKILLQTNSRIFAPIYPKIPIYSHSSTLNPLLEFVMAQGEKYGYSNLVLIGDSSGANIALSIALLMKKHNRQPREIILLSPGFDCSLENPEIDEKEGSDSLLSKKGILFCAKLWASDVNIHDSTVSPINGDLIGLARTSIFIGTSDLLEPDCMKFYKLAKDKNVMVDLHRYQGLCHDFMMFGFLEESKSVLQRVISLINQ